MNTAFRNLAKQELYKVKEKIKVLKELERKLQDQALILETIFSLRQNLPERKESRPALEVLRDDYEVFSNHWYAD